MPDRQRRPFVAFARSAVLALAATGAASAQDSSTAERSKPAADYIRVVDDEGGNRVRLQTSSRAFKPSDGNGPEVHLVGAMHIGDKAYYDALQEYLDRHEVVLYEGVKPSGAGEDATAAPDDAAKRRLTEQRLRLLAILVERQKRSGGSYPESLDAMIDSLPRTHARLARGATVDGWGHVIALVEIGRPPGDESEPGAPGFDLVSAGADGAPGGEGDAADLRFSDQKPLSKSEVDSKQDGIQTRMADALGLEFQLSAIDYSHPNWRNSDLSVDVVQKKLADAGASGDALFSMLNGTSFSAKIAGFIFNIINASPQSRAMGKLMMVEMLSSADDLLNAGGAGNLGKMMSVIILDRNQAVFDDLKAIIEHEKGVKSVALFYGGGHIPDLEKRIESELGYAFTGETWFTGIDLDMKKAGLDAAQASAIRKMIRQTIETQLKRAAREPERR